MSSMARAAWASCTSIAGATIELRCAFETSAAAPAACRSAPRAAATEGDAAALGPDRRAWRRADHPDQRRARGAKLFRHARPDARRATGRCWSKGCNRRATPGCPAVSIHRQFKVLIEDELDGLFGDGLRLVADPSAASSTGAVLRETLRRTSPARDRAGGRLERFRSSASSRRTASRPSAWVRARCAPTRPALHCLRSCTPRYTQSAAKHLS